MLTRPARLDPSPLLCMHAFILQYMQYKKTKAQIQSKAPHKGNKKFVKTTPQRCQSYLSPLRFGAPMLFTPCRSRTPPSAPPLRGEGSRNGSWFVEPSMRASTLCIQSNLPSRPLPSDRDASQRDEPNGLGSKTSGGCATLPKVLQGRTQGQSKIPGPVAACHAWLPSWPGAQSAQKGNLATSNRPSSLKVGRNT